MLTVLAAASALAVTYPRSGAHLGSFAERLSGYVVDEHAALDARRTWPGVSSGPGGPNGRRCGLHAPPLVFPAMGRNYLAAVIAAGFSGISLGATPTAIANMTAVSKAHGAAPTAFIILPLVSAFFIDIVNALVIGLFVR